MDFGPRYELAKADDRVVRVGDINPNASQAQTEQIIKYCLGHDHCIFYWPSEKDNRKHQGWCYTHFIHQAATDEAVEFLSGLRILGQVASIERLALPTVRTTPIEAAPRLEPSPWIGSPSSSAPHALASAYILAASTSQTPTPGEAEPSSTNAVIPSPASATALAASPYHPPKPATAKAVIKDPLTDLKKLRLKGYPHEWVLDKKDPKKHILEFFTRYKKIASLYENAGICHSLVNENHSLPAFYSRQYPTISTHHTPGVYVVMFRPAKDPRKSNAMTKNLDTRQLMSWEYAVLPLPCQGGWKLWRHPDSPMTDRGRDSRFATRVTDTSTTDRPHEDTWRFFDHGLDLLNASNSRIHWQPGQLLGPDGSQPEVKASSISFAPSFVPPSQPLADNRVSTSGGIAIKHIRPSSVGLGWGDYDLFSSWEAHGRHTKKEWVEQKYWRTNRVNEYLRFVDEYGKSEVVSSELNVYNSSLYPFETPQPLYEHLNSGNKRKYEGGRGSY